MVTETVLRALDEVCDPEIPVVTIRELGILRDVRETPEGVDVVITPTYSGCPAMQQIEDDILAALSRAGSRGRVTTQLAPAWSTDWITPEAREKLRAYGISPPTPVQAGEPSVVRFASRAAARVDVPCPRCGSSNTSLTSHFGSTACKALYRCLDCLEPFDLFKPY